MYDSPNRSRSKELTPSMGLSGAIAMAGRFWPFVALALLQILDFHSTLLAMLDGRSEANPFILLVAGRIGLMPAVCLFKIAALFFTGIYFQYARHKKQNFFMSIPLYGVILIYVITVINNYS